MECCDNTNSRDTPTPPSQTIGFECKNRSCKSAETEIKYGKCLETERANYEFS